MIRVRFDDRQRLICVGDTVKVTYVDSGRGAHLWMDEGTVVGFARTRVVVRFPSRVQPQRVGSECLRVLPPLVDPATLHLVDEICPKCGAVGPGLWVNVPPNGESMCGACHKALAS